MSKLYKSADWLQEQYWEKELSQREIAKIARCTSSVIRYWMRKHNICARTTWAKHNYCIDCGVKISWGAMRCWYCAARKRSEETPKAINYCIDCNAEICRYSTRCNSCATKKQWADSRHRHYMSKVIKENWVSGIYNTEEWKRKQSEATKEAWKNRVYTEERNRKISESLYRRWANGDFGEEWRRKNSETTKQSWLNGSYDGVFKSPTSIEIQISAALDIMGIEHIPQYRPEGCTWVYDEFVTPDLFIEVQGDYWHGDKNPDRQEKDVQKANWARRHGFLLIEIWEHEIKTEGAWSLVKKHIWERI